MALEVLEGIEEIGGFEEIKGFYGYVINRNGKIRSIDRFTYHPRFENKKQFIEGKELKKQIDKDGYETIGLRKNNKLYVKKVHRLVAETFIPNDKNHPMINHKNSVRNDNRVENLEWCNNSMNQKHSFMGGTRNTCGENHSHNKLTEKDVIEIITLFINGMNKRQISKSYNVTAQTIGNIFNGKSWSDITYLYAENLISTAIDILEKEKFPCIENAMIIHRLGEALDWSEERKLDREKRQVEGKSQP
jgi:hypothetical protein